MDQNGPFWSILSCEYQNPVRNKVISTKMVVLDHFGPFWSSTLFDSIAAAPYFYYGFVPFSQRKRPNPQWIGGPGGAHKLVRGRFVGCSQYVVATCGPRMKFTTLRTS